jgi:hypothetical protein
MLKYAVSFSELSLFQMLIQLHTIIAHYFYFQLTE